MFESSKTFSDLLNKDKISEKNNAKNFKEKEVYLIIEDTVTHLILLSLYNQNKLEKLLKKEQKFIHFLYLKKL